MIIFPSSPDACPHYTFQFVSCLSEIVMPAYLTRIIPLPYLVVSCLFFIDCVCNVVLSLIICTSSEVQQTPLVLQTQIGSLY